MTVRTSYLYLMFSGKKIYQCFRIYWLGKMGLCKLRNVFHVDVRYFPWNIFTSSNFPFGYFHNEQFPNRQLPQPQRLTPAFILVIALGPHFALWRIGRPNLTLGKFLFGYTEQHDKCYLVSFWQNIRHSSSLLVLWTDITVEEYRTPT